MKENQLGKAGIKVTELALGTLTMSPMQRGLTIDEGSRIILHALEQGINFIDTAQMYGSYPQVSLALQKWQGPAPVIASKSTAKTGGAMKEALDECLSDLKLKSIDVFLLHAVRDIKDFDARREALNVLLDAKKKGKVRAVGISSHSALFIEEIIKDERVEIIHPMINREGIGILDADLEKMKEILKNARANGKGIYAMKPLGGGHLRNDAAAALRWVFDSGLVDSAAVGMTSYEEIDMNIAVARHQKIDSVFAEKVAGQPRHLFINEMICENCGACIAACQQNALLKGEKHPQIIHRKCVLCGYCAPACPKFAIRIV